MNVSRMLRWCVPVACLMAAGLFASSAEAGPLVAQPNLTPAVVPATIGFHRGGWGGGWGNRGSYRGFGSYYYGRPSLYYSGYRGFGGYGGYGGGYNYRPAYSYGYASPYYRNSYSSPSCSCGSSGYSSYSSGSYYQPAAYSQPVVYSQPMGYSQPVVYSQPGYSSGQYARPALYYSGYSSNSYPAYQSVGFGGGGFGYSNASPYYYSGGQYGGHW